MPRHRIERAPRFRTLWPSAGLSAGRVRPAHARVARRGSWLSSSQRQLLTRTVRGLVVSPWFAAGAGFVVAAAVVVMSPHARLNSAIEVMPCKQAGCPTPAPQGVAPPEPAGIGVGRIPGGTSAASGLTFGYYVMWQNPHGFSMLITVRGERPLGSWRLKLVIPGATHLSISGAHWKPSSRDAGTASPLARSGETDAASATPILKRGRPASAELARGENIAQFVISGMGTAGAPTGCVYKGAQCQFVAVSQSP